MSYLGRLPFCTLGPLALSAALTLSCQSTEPPSAAQEPPEPSPNAQILPAPLSEQKGRSSAVVTQNQEEKQGLPTPFAVDQMLPLQPPLAIAPGGAPPGFDLSYEWTLPLEGVAFRGASASGKWEVGLVADGPQTPARVSVSMRSGFVSLGEGSELRMQSDRLGAILVWPDGRSYRVVPKGAFYTLFGERRVDVMPLFDGEWAEQAIPGAKGEGESWAITVKSPLGQARLSGPLLPETGRSGALLCAVFLEWLRVRDSAVACKKHFVPTHAVFRFAAGGELVARASDPKKVLEPLEKRFRVPPEMPIWKPGELPPEDAEELPGPREQGNNTGPIVFKNAHEFPMWVILGQKYRARLEPVSQRTLELPLPLSYRAIDFLGQIAWQSGDLSRPSSVQLGAPAEAAASPGEKAR